MQLINSETVLHDGENASNLSCLLSKMLMDQYSTADALDVYKYT